MPEQDRLAALCQQDTLTGIDFVQVVDPAVQTLLRVFFLIDPDEISPALVSFPLGDPTDADFPPEDVTITSISGGESLAKAEVVSATWRQATIASQQRVFLEVEVAEPGDFSIYRLTIESGSLDRFFKSIEFSFKQGCPSRLDCKAREDECPPEALRDFPVDYLARDFTSFRNALLDFAVQRYPKWAELNTADAGIMLAELMAALGDEFSYIQDRYARESFLATATERRSLRWHSRLIDYPIHNGLSATTYLAVESTAAAGAYVTATETRTWAIGEGGRAIPFEIGAGLREDGHFDDREFWIHADWSSIPVHNPDPAELCLPVGTNEIYLVGHYPDDQLPPASSDSKVDTGKWVGRLMLIESVPDDPSIPVRRHMVAITEVETGTDPLCGNIEFTRVSWSKSEGLPYQFLFASTRVCVNMLPAIAGETLTENFAVGSIPANLASTVSSVAVEREGACNAQTNQRSLTYLYSLKKTESQSLGWQGELRAATPEIELVELDQSTGDPITSEIWTYSASLLQEGSQEEGFTLENGTWKTIFEVERFGKVFSHADYTSQDGFTLRFGDGEFGKSPGDPAAFRVTYRTGAGTTANLPEESVTELTDPTGSSSATTLDSVASAVRNPFPITSGVDPEDPEVVRQLAPEAFKAETLRAVRDEDYAEHAEKIEGVQNAGASARWTGSWLSEFVTVDPLDTFSLSEELRTSVEDRLDCVRQVGREIIVPDPVYLNIDLFITICIEPTAFAGQVLERVVHALTVKKQGLYEKLPFFHPDNFTFGTPLHRAALEAAVQAVPGVLAVDKIEIEARGVTDRHVFSDLIFEVTERQILRLQNDPRFPERGSLIVTT